MKKINKLVEINKIKDQFPIIPIFNANKMH